MSPTADFERTNVRIITFGATFPGPVQSYRYSSCYLCDKEKGITSLDRFPVSENVPGFVWTTRRCVECYGFACLSHFGMGWWGPYMCVECRIWDEHLAYVKERMKRIEIKEREKRKREEYENVKDPNDVVFLDYFYECNPNHDGYSSEEY